MGRPNPRVSPQPVQPGLISGQQSRSPETQVGEYKGSVKMRRVETRTLSVLDRVYDPTWLYHQPQILFPTPPGLCFGTHIESSHRCFSTHATGGFRAADNKTFCDTAISRSRLRSSISFVATRADEKSFHRGIASESIRVCGTKNGCGSFLHGVAGVLGKSAGG